ncbi:MAG: hypothetical protein LBR73_07310 [Oscillospiraceae bacterium]|jgi:DNA polymerase-3 subunit delta'|nr:hypothetical protein [Oscillospiraceae bacterium]
MEYTVNLPTLSNLPSLTDALRSGRFPHAVILEGGTAASRLAAAKDLAAALLCEPATADSTEPEADAELFGGMSLFGPAVSTASEPQSAEIPCGQCRHCRKTAAGTHPDLLVTLGPETERGFHIEAVREIRDSIALLPNEARRKVYIVHNAHSMTAQAQNALLKTLEEPPPYAVLILTCTVRSALLDTVLSRAPAFSLSEAGGEMLPEEADVRMLAANICEAYCKSGANAFACLAATAPLAAMGREGLRDVLKFLRETLHGKILESALANNTSAAASLLRKSEAVRALEQAILRNANQNILLTRLAVAGTNS